MLPGLRITSCDGIECCLSGYPVSTSGARGTKVAEIAYSIILRALVETDSFCLQSEVETEILSPSLNIRPYK